MKKETWGSTADGTPVELYTLVNPGGMKARITNYGGILVLLRIPGKNGSFDDVVLGFDSLAEYLRRNPHLGCVVGRYANRIAGGKFSLNGKEYHLAVNAGRNSLHGGLKGFDKVVWIGTMQKGKQDQSVILTYLSKDGEEGYPGNLNVEVVYTLTDNNELKIEYSAVTDKPTILNLTHHSYFNLAGAGKGDILNHEMTINADKFTPIDSEMIPTGELKEVAGTPFDFRKPVQIGARINTDNEQLRYGKGYDHNYVLDKKGNELSFAASVYEKSTGRVMEVFTTEPGVQFYTGNFLDGSYIGKSGIAYNQRYGFCLETQHFPDSPNKTQFPPVILNPGVSFTSTTMYKFSIR
ncbi:MAG: aldose epimerase family protein [Bacteroidota bacterium]